MPETLPMYKMRKKRLHYFVWIASRFYKCIIKKKGPVNRTVGCIVNPLVKIGIGVLNKANIKSKANLVASPNGQAH